MKEKEFREKLADIIEGGKVIHSSGKATEDKSYIEDVKRNKNHPSRKRGRPDIHIYHSNKTNLKWRYLSNPFFIECKLDGPASIAEGLLQMQQYKFVDGGELGIRKYGDFHVALAIPSLVFGEKWRGVYYNDFYLERILWHMGLGLVRRYGNDIWIRFNEREEIRIEGEWNE